MLGATLVGRYVIKRLLGEGANGSVYEAENVAIRRLVAIKVVRSDAGQNAIERLYREATLIAAVYHPNVCDVYDFGTTDAGAPFVVLERLFGETLARFFTLHAPMPGIVARELFVQLLSGMHAAHGAGIIHRDLKPKNVFLVDRIGCAPLVKIVDFGLARGSAQHPLPTLTKKGFAVGTPRYMSPEQLSAESIDHRSDLWSVGVMLYEALTGTHPFDGETVADITANTLRTNPRPVSSIRPKLDARVDALIARALAKKPDDRFPDALSMQRELAHVLH